MLDERLNGVIFMRRTLLLGTMATGSLLAMASVAPSPSNRFTVLKNSDTIAVEDFSRDAVTLSGTVVQANGVRTEYVANLRADQTVDHVEMRRQPLKGDEMRISLDLSDTAATASVRTQSGVENEGFKTRARALPFLLASFALSEQIVRATRPQVGQTKTITVVRLGTGDTATVTVSRIDDGTVLVNAPQGAVRLVTSADGDVISGTVPSMHWVVERGRRASK